MSPADPDDRHEVDERLRREFDPDAALVARVVSSSLATNAPSNRRWWVAVAVSIVVIALVGLVASRNTQPVAAGIQIEVRAAHRAAFRITSSGGAVTVTAPSGQVVAIVAGGQS